MNPVIAQALEAICIERDEREYDKSFDLVARLIETLGEENLAERLFIEIPRNTPFELVAELFDLLAWQTDDNGSEIARTAERWLRECSDVRKLLIALNLEAFPFSSDEEMVVVLSAVAASKPRVAKYCQKLIESRMKSGHVG